ncbi:hypothetical protein ACK8P5_25920 (plasmid) [Paenibacillus sp. EC2-1]|uniref:hypothetical protein n=1 Tax=Paenibacillus sp. EC2-1 TaxID=3388665 RepID=UPI003BEEB8C9
MVSRCAICRCVISDIFSLCDDNRCEAEWDEATDSYNLPDGRVFTFSPATGFYEEKKFNF